MLTQKTPPASEVVFGSDVRKYLRMDSTEYDDILDDYAAAARLAAEKWTRRSFIYTTWYYTLDENKIGDSIRLPRPPLSTSTAPIITTYDFANAAHTQLSTTYTVDTYVEPGRIFLNIGAIWNIPRRERSAMRIEYVSGYGSMAASVPADIKLAITETAAWWYNSGEITDIPQKVIERLQPYRVLLF